MYNSNSKTDQKGKNWISIILSFVKNAWDLRIIRFIVIGSFNTLFDTSLLLIIVKISGLSPVIVNSVSVSIAITVSYFLNHRIVFRQKSSYSLKKYIRFFLITGLGVIIIQDTIIYLVTDKFWIVNKTIAHYIYWAYVLPKNTRVIRHKIHRSRGWLDLELYVI